MLKRISAFILALTMLCVTACSDDNSSDTSKAESSSSVSEQATDSSSADSSEDPEASSSQTETTTTASETTTTSETTTKTKASDDSSASDTTTKATADAKTTTTQASAGYKTTTKATTTTTKTTTTTTKNTTTTTKVTQPPVQKSALDLAYEAMVKCNTPTQAQINLITNDLNNYIKSKGFCTKSILDASFYPFEKNGKPTFDINESTNFGNCGFYEGRAQDNPASAYYEGRATLEQAREQYKKELKAHVDFQMNMINDQFQSKKKNGSEYTTIRYSVMIYRNHFNPMQRFDLELKYPNFRQYVMTIGYKFDW